MNKHILAIGTFFVQGYCLSLDKHPRIYIKNRLNCMTQKLQDMDEQARLRKLRSFDMYRKIQQMWWHQQRE